MPTIQHGDEEYIVPMEHLNDIRHDIWADVKVWLEAQHG